MTTPMPLGEIIQELEILHVPADKANAAIAAAVVRLKELTSLIGAVSNYNNNRKGYERSFKDMHDILAGFGAS